MSGARAGVVGLALLALASGCGGSPVPPPPPPAPVVDHWPGCVAVGAFADPFQSAPPSGIGAVPPGFAPTAAILCSRTGEVSLERTATAIGPLLTYLALPREPPTNGACPAIGWIEPWLFLVDAGGRYVAPAIPVDECGQPLGDVDQQAAWLTLAYTDRVVGRG